VRFETGPAAESLLAAPGHVYNLSTLGEISTGGDGAFYRAVTICARQEFVH
jgi:hypothetical protein